MIDHTNMEYAVNASPKSHGIIFGSREKARRRIFVQCISTTKYVSQFAGSMLYVSEEPMTKSSNIFRGQNQPEKRDARSQSPQPTQNTRRCHLNHELVPAEENLNRIDGFLMIPSSLLSEEPYRELPGESKLLYGHLLGLLRLSAQDTTGHWKANGRPCVSLSRASAGRLLHCQREKAAGLFAALERCGLLEPVPGQSNGKARRYYLNLPRSKEPNEL